MRFPRSVAAARGLAEAKFELAEALATEIPPRRRGPTPAGEQSIPEQLSAAAAEIEAETGEVYSTATLTDYREVALWVSRGTTGNSFDWADASWTAHVEARQKGETFEQFAADPTTKRRVRARNGGSTGDVPAAARAINDNPAEAEKFVEGLSDQGMEALAEAALDREVRAAGIEPQPHRTPADPQPRWYRLSRRIELDLIEINGEIKTMRADGQTALADSAIDRMRAILARGIAEMEDIPDTVEGLT